MSIAELGVKVTSKGLLITNKELDKLARVAPKAEGKVKRLNKSSKVLTRTMRRLGAVMGLTMGAMLFGTVRVLSGFESGMSKVAAVTRASTVELTAMRDIAKELGSTTEFTAAQAASGLAFLGMAGFSAAESISAIPAVLDLATAATMDLGTAADISSNIMSAFGIAATDAVAVTDVLAAAASRANTDVLQLGTAMKFVGPIASALDISVNDAAAAIGVLSDAGLQGTMAGTGLRRVLSSLVNPTGDAEDAIKSLGLKLEDVNPELHSVVDIVDVLAEAGLGAADALTIFGDRGGPAILALTSQAGNLRTLTNELNDVEGAAKTMADTMRDNLGGDITIFKSAVTGLIIALGEAGLTDALRGVFQAMTNGVRFLTDFSGYMDAVTVAVKAASVAVVALGATHIPMLILGLRVAVSGMTAASVATGIFTKAVNLARFATMALGGPLGIVWGLIGAAGAAWILFKDNTDKAETSIDAATAASRALNVALGDFYYTAAPSAGKSAIDLANDNKTLAKSALDAAAAELAKVEALSAAFEARQLGVVGIGGSPADNAWKLQLAESEAKLLAARGVLDDARAALDRAATAVTGTMSETMTENIDISRKLTIDIDKTTKATGDLGDEVETLADKFKNRLTTAIDDLSDAFGDWMERGFKDFGSFAKSMVDIFKRMIIDMIMIAAKNKILVSLGLGGATGGLGGAAGTGMLGAAMGGFATAGTAAVAGTAGTGLLGGLGASLGIGGAAGGGIFGVGASAAAAGGGLMATIGAALPVIGIVAALFSIFRRKPAYKEKDFNAIQAAIELTNAELLNTNTAGQHAATSLKKLVGGMGNLNSLTQSYYSNFFTQEEQRLKSVEAIDSVFASLNMETPETASQFRSIIEAQDLMTDSGRKTYATMLQVSGAFADVYGGANKVNQALSVMTGSQGVFATLQDEIFANAAQSNGYLTKIATTRENDSEEVKTLLREIVTAVRSGNINLSRNTAQTVALLERQELEPAA